MMPIYTVQTHFDSTERRIGAASAFTLIETMVAMAIAALIVAIAVFNLTEPVRRSSFDAQAEQFVATMQNAVTYAHQTSRRYEVIIDLVEQQYTLREISSDNLTEVREEEIMAVEDFSGNCQVDYVEFDDPDEDIVAVDSDTETLLAKFRAGPAGWQYGGKIVLRELRDDWNDRFYTVVVSTLSRVVKLEEGDVEILKSKRPNELPF